MRWSSAVQTRPSTVPLIPDKLGGCRPAWLQLPPWIRWATLKASLSPPTWVLVHLLSKDRQTEFRTDNCGRKKEKMGGVDGGNDALCFRRRRRRSTPWDCGPLMIFHAFTRISDIRHRDFKNLDQKPEREKQTLSLILPVVGYPAVVLNWSLRKICVAEIKTALWGWVQRLGRGSCGVE